VKGHHLFKHVKCLFIDFDGTLVDTIPILFKNYLAFLKTFGYEGTQKEFESLIGPSIEEFVPILKERYLLSESSHKLTQVYLDGLADQYKEEARLLNGALDFLTLATRLNLPMTLVTSSSYSLIEKSLDALDLKKFFSHLITGDQVKKTKPDPEIYLRALKICRVSPLESLAIEDSFNGLTAAIKAHIPSIAIKNPLLVQVPPEVKMTEDWPTFTRLLATQTT
jgi:HAD superfamily hydrolase (TIGR01509 family)